MALKTEIAEGVNGADGEAGGDGGDGAGAGVADDSAARCQDGQRSGRIGDVLGGWLLGWVLTVVQGIKGVKGAGGEFVCWRGGEDGG